MIQEVIKDLEIDVILNKAKLSRKGSYSVYEDFKSQLQDLGISSVQYEKATRRLAKILRV